MPDRALSGVGVLVTRPLSQSQELVEAIEARGGTAICFPVLQIIPRDATEIAASVAALRDPEIVIFVSRNAVQFGMAYMANGLVAAVGPATATALEESGRKVDIRPASGFDSEHLLAEPALNDVTNKVVRIVRGSDGRELLADTLRERGALVEYLSVYSRQIPRYSDLELNALETRWRAGDVDVVIVMSVASAQNLEALLPQWCKKQLNCGSLVAPAARVLKEALKTFPGASAILAAGPLTSDMVDAIIELGHTAPGQS